MSKNHAVDVNDLNNLAQMVDGLIELKEKEQQKDLDLCNDIEKLIGQRVAELEQMQNLASQIAKLMPF